MEVETSKIRISKEGRALLQHEIRNSLTVILGCSHILARKFDANHETETIDRQVKHIASVIDRLEVA